MNYIPHTDEEKKAMLSAVGLDKGSTQENMDALFRSIPEELQIKGLDIEDLPVVASSKDNRFVGILNCRAVHRALSAEVLSRQQKADSIHSAV